MKAYDLILVVGYFRTAASFLSVILALGKSIRIGVLPVEADPSLKQKTGDAHQIFLELCRRFGADIVPLGEPVAATLMVVQQFPYSKDLVNTIKTSVTATHCVGMMTLATAGLDKHDAFLGQFDICKVYVPSQRFMKFLLEKRWAQARYDKVSIHEVGLPFAQHRPFPEFTADWIIAAPTLFSFHSEAGKQQFLQSVIQLLGQIPPDDLVAYKSHNGNSRDYFAPRLHHLIAGWIAKVPGTHHLLQFLRRQSWPWLRLQAERIQTCLLHRAILRRAIPMPHLTPYAGMSLEAFLPGVRKGVIGGLSNTIWGTLYFDLPYYNCVDESARHSQSELLNKRSDALLDVNLQFFGVPFCRGSLGIDTRKQGIVHSNEREGDLVATIMSDLGLAHSVSGSTP